MRYHLTWLIDKFDKGQSPGIIFFSDHSKKQSSPYGEHMFSQWYPSPFSVNEIVYKSAGHWMMARKALLFGDRKAFKRIIEADRLEEVRIVSHMVNNFDEATWSERKYDIVREGNFHKFNQGKKLRERLLNTGTAILAEANPADNVWGIGLSQDSRNAKDPYAWKGLNLLGFALMEIREYLRQISEFDSSRVDSVRNNEAKQTVVL